MFADIHPLVSRLLTPALLVLALGVAAPAFAQDAQPAPKEDRTAPAAPSPAVSSPASPSPASPSSGRPAASLPNGASSINETYGDWTIACRINNGDKDCVFSQAQGDSKTGQQIFAVELRVPKNGKTDGVLLLPFGLKLDDGVRLKIDDQNLGQGARFSTCYQQGCLVPVSFPTVATDAMMKGTNFVVTASNLNGAEAATFTVSLNGFTAAFKRVVQLGG